MNFYRAVQSREPQALAQAVALTFMGVRPASWPKERWSGMAAFFSQIAYKPTIEWKEEIVLFDLEKAATEAAAKTLQTAAFPDGTPAKLSPGQDPREAFADWLLAPRTRGLPGTWPTASGSGCWAAASSTRRTTCGRTTRPAIPELLAYLEQELVASRYDVKHLCRLILNSATYQRSHISTTEDSQGEANFACYPLRRLEAEVLIDALCQITGTTEQYSSIIPEPYTFMPEEQRAVALADASITSPFLEKFGRSSRDTRPGVGPQQSAHGGAAAAPVELQPYPAEVRNEPQAAAPAAVQRQEARRDRRRAVPDDSLALPDGRRVEDPGNLCPDQRPRDVLRDLAWALINCPEFSYRH